MKYLSYNNGQIFIDKKIFDKTKSIILQYENDIIYELDKDSNCVVNVDHPVGSFIELFIKPYDIWLFCEKVLIKSKKFYLDDEYIKKCLEERNKLIGEIIANGIE